MVVGSNAAHGTWTFRPHRATLRWVVEQTTPGTEEYRVHRPADEPGAPGGWVREDERGLWASSPDGLVHARFGAWHFDEASYAFVPGPGPIDDGWCLNADIARVSHPRWGAFVFGLVAQKEGAPHAGWILVSPPETSEPVVTVGHLTKSGGRPT